IATVGAGVTGYSDSSTTEGTTYVYKVQAMYNWDVSAPGDSNRDSAMSSPATGQTTANRLPVAAITSVSPEPSIVGDTVTLVGSCTDADGDSSEFDWDFGDGSVQNGSASTVMHAYVNPGTLTVKLTCKDLYNNQLGAPATRSHTVNA